ncbi:MAG: exosortase-associated EpsI family protein [Sedimentisphaerales bacterium]|nr:exosortase-associated EpsI family protein [Sedimentisphaerales bacterium]
MLLVSAGMTYRILASSLERVVNRTIKLPVPLSNFPTQIGNWVGKDLPIPNTTKEYMERNFADDYFSRRYVKSGAWADVYVVFCSSRPGGILGHRPRKCYVGNGWIHDTTETDQFISWTGQEIPYLLHHFHKPEMTDQAVVLNFYVLNGRLTADENDFSGLFGRRINIAGDLAKYVAQVQISSKQENSVRMMAKDVVGLILEYLPDQNGKVRAVDDNNLYRR